MTETVPPSPVLAEVAAERARQDDTWGEQNHPDGVGGPDAEWAAVHARMRCHYRDRAGGLTWRDVLDEEVAEAYAETDPAKLRAELVQVAAVAVAWIEAIDRRTAPPQAPAAPAGPRVVVTPARGAAGFTPRRRGRGGRPS